MPAPFLLSRVLLRFDKKSSQTLEHLSAISRTPEGHLWLASDELATVERLAPLEPCVFGQHQSFAMRDFIPLDNEQDEIDIEGMDYANGYLWWTGSHSKKRKKAKGKTPDKDIQRIETIQTEYNRYLLARIPVVKGTLYKSCPHPDQPDQQLTAGCLKKTEHGNLLTDALKEDSHLGPFVSFPLPAKENGFDIEGLAVSEHRVFVGLRGPVLQQWAVILELELIESEPGVLILREIGASGRLYKKHFVDLSGLGIRELCFQGQDLLILAGPTMALAGAMRIFRLYNALDRPGDSLSAQEEGELEAVCDLPFTPGSDHAEGLALFPCLGQSRAVVIVYDGPHTARQPEAQAVFADVFQLQ